MKHNFFYGSAELQLGLQKIIGETYVYVAELELGAPTRSQKFQPKPRDSFVAACLAVAPKGQGGSGVRYLKMRRFGANFERKRCIASVSIKIREKQAVLGRSRRAAEKSLNLGLA